jgi:hydroxyacylglutathione hydrolase
MIPFYLMKRLWRIVGFYITKIMKSSHPVTAVFSFDTFLRTIKVLLIPTLWDNYSYIVISGNQAVVVDPSDHKAISKELDNRKLQLKYILVTHDHIDHISGIVELQKRYGSSKISYGGFSVPAANTKIQNGYTLSIDNVSFEAISVPGHYSFPYSLESTKHNIAWYCEKARILFTGDTLFSCGYGFIAHGNEKAMWESLRRLRLLPDETFLYCGHEYTLRNTIFASEIDPDNTFLKQRLAEVKELLKNHKPTIPLPLKLEKAINPFLRWDDENLKKQHGISNKGDFESFLYIRKLKNEFNKRK